MTYDDIRKQLPPPKTMGQEMTFAIPVHRREGNSQQPMEIALPMIAFARFYWGRGLKWEIWPNDGTQPWTKQ